MPDRKKPLLFESPAEEAIFPIIERLCVEFDFELRCQYKIMESVEEKWDYRDWVYEKYNGDLPEWLEEKHQEECGGEGGCRFCYTSGGYDYEKYRLDFFLKKDNIKYAVEIDGKDFHDKNHDKIRDNFCRKMGIETIRFSGRDAILHKDFIEKKLRKIITERFKATNELKKQKRLF